MKPQVTIIIPTYNRSSFLGETLESVLEQTYKDWECIVVDDGSLDYTTELMEFFCERDSRIKFTTRPPNSIKGANTCRNYGFALSKGNFIQYLDSDDLISPNKLEEQVNLLDRNSLAISTTKWGVFTHGDGNLYQDLKSYKDYDDAGEFLRNMYKSYGYFPPNAYLIPRDLIKKAGGWNEYLRINQDGEFMTRIICNCEAFYFAQDSFALYRASRPDSTSVITRENIFDHYQCLKLIDSYLKIRFKDEEISEFENVKRQAFYRIPDELSFIYKNDKAPFTELISEKKRTQSFTKRLKKKIKRLIK